VQSWVEIIESWSREVYRFRVLADLLDLKLRCSYMDWISKCTYNTDPVFVVLESYLENGHVHHTADTVARMHVIEALVNL